MKENIGSFNLLIESAPFTPDVGRPLNISGLTAIDTGTPADYLGTVDLSAITIDSTGRHLEPIQFTHNTDLSRLGRNYLYL